jgi:hypothetical protein
MVTGDEFLTVMFTSAYAKSWPTFAINLTLLPISLLEVDAVVRAYEGHRFWVVELQVVFCALMVLALRYGVPRFGLIGAISVVVGTNLLWLVLLAARFGRVLGLNRRDLWLFKDVAKLALASP